MIGWYSGVLAGGLVVAAGVVAAQDAGRFGIGVGASTLGPTVEGSYRVNDGFGLRVPAGFVSADYDGTEDGIDFEIDADFGGVGLLADYYPGLAGLRLSGGAILSGYSAEGRGRGDGEVGGTSYTGVDLDLDATPANTVMPTLSIGYEGRLGARWSLSADLGAMYTGGFDVDLVDRSGQVAQSDIDAEIAEIEDDLPDYLPYLQLVATFRF